MMFNMLTIGVYAIDNNANDIVLNRKEYALSKIKSVNMFGTENACDYNRRPFYTVHNRNIYYIDQNSILKTIDIDTKTEESILDINKWIKEIHIALKMIFICKAVKLSNYSMTHIEIE